METLSIVTTKASAKASRPKYGFSPVPSQIQPPSGSSVSRETSDHRRVGAARRGQRDPDLVERASSRRAGPPASGPPARPAGTGRWCRPTSTATSGRGRCASRGAQVAAAAGEPLRRDPVQRRAGHEDVRAGQLVMAVDDHEVEPRGDPCAGSAPARPPCPAPHRRPTGRGHAAAADQQVRPGRRQGARPHGGERRGPDRRRRPSARAGAAPAPAARARARRPRRDRAPEPAARQSPR